MGHTESIQLGAFLKIQDGWSFRYDFQHFFFYFEWFYELINYFLYFCFETCPIVLSGSIQLGNLMGNSGHFLQSKMADMLHMIYSIFLILNIFYATVSYFYVFILWIILDQFSLVTQWITWTFLKSKMAFMVDQISSTVLFIFWKIL